MKSFRGFTLVEILLVVVLLGVIAAVSIPLFSKTAMTLQLQSTSQDIAYLMRYAQSRAITRGCPSRLVWDETFSKYWLEESVSEEETEEYPVYQRIPGRLGKTFKIPRGKDGRRLTVKTENPSVAFFPDGQIEKVRIEVCHDRYCRTVTSEEERGSVTVFENNLE